MKRRMIACLFPLFMGTVLLTSVINKPRFETYQRSDVVMLFLSGCLFTVGLALLFGMVKRRGA